MKYLIALFTLAAFSAFAQADPHTIKTPHFYGPEHPLTESAYLVAGVDVDGAPVLLKLTADGSLSISPSETSVTPTIAANTASGTITEGCKSLLLIASADFSGTVLDNFPLPAGASINIPVPAGASLTAVGFTVAYGTLYSVEVR